MNAEKMEEASRTHLDVPSFARKTPIARLFVRLSRLWLLHDVADIMIVMFTMRPVREGRRLHKCETESRNTLAFAPRARAENQRKVPQLVTITEGHAIQSLRRSIQRKDKCNP
jgi:hypothetical protein